MNSTARSPTSLLSHPAPVAGSPIDLAQRTMEAGSLAEQIERAERAVVARDDALRLHLAQAAMQAQDLARGSRKWLAGAAAAGVAGWLLLRTTRRSSHVAEVPRRSPPRPTSKGREPAAVRQVKSASRWGAVSAAVSLLSTLAHGLGTARRLGLVSFGRSALALARRMRRPAETASARTMSRVAVPAAAGPDPALRPPDPRIRSR